jgi:hypothetical protein
MKVGLILKGWYIVKVRATQEERERVKMRATQMEKKRHTKLNFQRPNKKEADFYWPITIGRRNFITNEKGQIEKRQIRYEKGRIRTRIEKHT